VSLVVEEPMHEISYLEERIVEEETENIPVRPIIEEKKVFEAPFVAWDAAR
jgi:hypothetical protein